MSKVKQARPRLAAIAGLCAILAVPLSAPAAQEPARPVVTRRADLPPTNDTARPAPIPAAVFAERSAFRSEALSPDGTALSYLQPATKGRTRLVVINPQTGERINSILFSDGTNIAWTRWISPDRMLINTYARVLTMGGFVLPMNRLMLAHPREGMAEFLVQNASGYNGGQVLHVARDGSHALIAHRGDGRLTEPSVFRYELKPGGAVTRLLEPRPGITEWVADDAGIVRVGMGWRQGAWQIQYRDSEAEAFRPIARIRPGQEERFFDALAIISGTGRGYVLDEGENGRVGLRVFDYLTREIVETVYEHPDRDIESVWIRDGKPLAAFYTDDREQVVWLDEAYRASHEQLRDLIKTEDRWITARSDDGRKMLVRAGSEADPGALYFYDADTQTLKEIVRSRPALDPAALARPVAISYTARDGTPIRAYLTLPKGREARGLPLILLPHGGPFGVRDWLRYDDDVQFLANRGYAVLQPNFRGSGGYGNAFYDLGIGEVGRGMQDDLDDAMDWAVGEGIADPGRVCVVGGSYGGYAALWAVLRNPERYACAASWAGVTDWNRMLRYDRRYLTERVNKWWSARVRGDQAADLDAVSAYRLAGQLARPVLLAHGTKDKRVPISQYNMFEKAARAAPVKPQTLVIKDEGHSFSSPESARAWFEALEGFLAKHNPADAAPATPVTAAAAPAAPASAMPWGGAETALTVALLRTGRR